MRLAGKLLTTEGLRDRAGGGPPGRLGGGGPVGGVAGGKPEGGGPEGTEGGPAGRGGCVCVCVCGAEGLDGGGGEETDGVAERGGEGREETGEEGGGDAKEEREGGACEKEELCCADDSEGGLFAKDEPDAGCEKEDADEWPGGEVVDIDTFLLCVPLLVAALGLSGVTMVSLCLRSSEPKCSRKDKSIGGCVHFSIG